MVELVHTWDLNTLRCLYCQHGTCCAWVKGLRGDFSRYKQLLPK